jgi:hypothetical protein
VINIVAPPIPPYMLSIDISVWNQFKADNPNYARPIPYWHTWHTINNYDSVVPLQHPYVLHEYISQNNTEEQVINPRPLPHILRRITNFRLFDWLTTNVLYDTCTATVKENNVVQTYRVHQYYWKSSDDAIIGRCGHRGCNYTQGPYEHTCFRIRVPMTAANPLGTIELKPEPDTYWNITKYYRCPDHTEDRDVRYKHGYNANY